MNTNIRWMIRRGMPRVLEIEVQSFDYPWSRDAFRDCLRQRNCIGMVAELDDEVAGFMIYELHKNRLHILNFAVAPEARRQGIGTAMMDKLVGKLSSERRNRILLEVSETNLGAHLFLRGYGFRATRILRDFYEEPDLDAYQFVIGETAYDRLEVV